MEIGRRQVVKGGAAAFLLALSLSPVARAAAIEQTVRITATASPVRAAEKPLAFELFYDLSRYVTARAALDRDVARELHAHFRQEEWGWKIAARIYADFRAQLSNGAGSVPEILSRRQLPDLDQWYCEHILDAWYEGMYRYDGSEVRVVYKDALMWSVVEDVLAVQGLSDKEYGYWEEPPEGVGVE